MTGARSALSVHPGNTLGILAETSTCDLQLEACSQVPEFNFPGNIIFTIAFVIKQSSPALKLSLFHVQAYVPTTCRDELLFGHRLRVATFIQSFKLVPSPNE